MNEWIKLKKENYMQDIIILFNGVINFSPNSMLDFSTKDFKSYDEYLDVQFKSINSSRTYFEKIYYGKYLTSFKGLIEKKTSSHILFKRILVDGCYHDGLGFTGKEDHVWMDISGFENYKSGDSIKFDADVYRYIKKNNGKLINYGLKNPTLISSISRYEIPSDEELIDQQINQLICETCIFYNHCFMGMCIADENERLEKFKFLKNIEPERFTQFTVLAAYEIAGQIFSQLYKDTVLDINDPNYKIVKKILVDANNMNAGCILPLNNTLLNLLFCEKHRIYI